LGNTDHHTEIENPFDRELKRRRNEYVSEEISQNPEDNEEEPSAKRQRACSSDTVPDVNLSTSRYYYVRDLPHRVEDVNLHTWVVSVVKYNDMEKAYEDILGQFLRHDAPVHTPPNIWNFQLGSLLAEVRTKLEAPEDMMLFFCYPRHSPIRPISDEAAFRVLLTELLREGVPNLMHKRGPYQLSFVIGPADLLSAVASVIEPLPEQRVSPPASEEALPTLEEDGSLRPVSATGADSSCSRLPDDEVDPKSSEVPESGEGNRNMGEIDDQVAEVRASEDYVVISSDFDSDSDCDTSKELPKHAEDDDDGPEIEDQVRQGRKVLRDMTTTDEQQYVHLAEELFGIKIPRQKELEPVSIKGLKRSLKVHQLIGVARMIDSISNGFPAMILADEMGYGKTTTALLFIWVRHTICRIYEEMSTSTSGKKHCTGSESVDRHHRFDCPSSSYASGIICPCIPGSITNRCVHHIYAVPGPTIVFASPQLLPQWQRDANDLFGDEAGISIIDGKAENQAMGGLAQLAAKAFTTKKLTKARMSTHARQFADLGDFLRTDRIADLVPKRGQSKLVLLCHTTTAMKSLLEKIVTTSTPREPDHAPTRIDRAMMPGLILQDECHKSKSRGTMVHRYIRAVAVDCEEGKSPIFIGLSGTPFSIDIMDIDNFYLFNRTHGKALREIQSSRVFNSLSDLNKLLRNVLNVGRSKNHDQLEILRKEIKQKISSLVAPWIVRRDENTKLFGRPIVEHPNTEITFINPDLPARFTSRAEARVKEFEAEISSLMADMRARDPETIPTYQDALNRWRQTHKGDLLAKLLTGSLPRLDGGLPLSLKTEKLFEAINAMRNGANALDSVYDAEFGRHIRPYLEYFPKLDEVIKIFDMARNDNTPDKWTGQVYRKKVVVLANSPVLAAAFAVGFHRRKPDVKASLLLAKMDFNRRKLELEYWSSLAESPEDDELAHNNSDILFSTKGILGTGTNLVRASYIILVDYAWLEADDSQAMKRVDRIGQRHHVHKYQLENSSDPVERALLGRRLRRGQEKQIIYGTSGEVDEQ
jgi:hypothetical protein